MKFGLFCFMLAMTTGASSVVAEQSVPVWVAQPSLGCAQAEMCAVGEGQTLNQAKSSARAEIAKIFQNKITSTFNVEQIQENGSDQFKARDAVSETSDMMLQAVEIKETYQDKDAFYALAMLNKATATQLTLHEIEGIDAKMTALWTEKTPAAATKLEQLYETRREVNQRYIVLTGNGLEEKYSYEQVFGNKKAVIGKRHIYLQADGGNAKFFEAVVRAVLQNNGYTFADKKSADVPTVMATMKSEQTYINVEGFVKYIYHFSLKMPTKDGKMIEVMAEIFEETGRSEVQTRKYALDSVREYLAKNILNLNL